jgi:hypothetical protein
MIAFGIILFTQAISELVPSDALKSFAYQGLGQRLEGVLVDGIMLWCVAILVSDSRGRIRILGILAMTAVLCVRAYAYRLAYIGTSLDATAAGLKLLYLLPFVWLFAASRVRGVALARRPTV